MLVSFLSFIYILVAILLILIIFVQKSKSGAGLGGLGGSTQLIFGGSGGQDFLQKITWVLGVILMSGSLILSILKVNDFARKHNLPTSVSMLIE